MLRKLSFLLSAILMMTILGCASIRPFTATANPVGKKVGVAQASHLWLPIFPIPIPLDENDTGIQKAAQSAGITRISTIDVKFYWWVFGWTEYTIVTGE
ncbi:MAG: hypothetical protein HZC28_08625 [Spirochaetes bacterium]|nr:hypothetical protein [Spirochaetota bacterium]